METITTITTTTTTPTSILKRPVRVNSSTEVKPAQAIEYPTMEQRVANFLYYYEKMFVSSRRNNGKVEYNREDFPNVPAKYSGSKNIVADNYIKTKGASDSYKNVMSPEDYELIVKDIECYAFSQEKKASYEPRQKKSSDSDSTTDGWTEVKSTKSKPKKSTYKAKSNGIGKNHDSVLSGLFLAKIMSNYGLRLVTTSEVNVGHPDLRVKSVGQGSGEQMYGGMIGSIDLLCLDRDNNLVIVDLKTVNNVYTNVPIEVLMMKEDHAIQMELYAYMFEYMSLRMMKTMEGHVGNSLSIAYNVIAGYDTANGTFGLWKVKRNPDKWILSKGIESRRNGIVLLIDDHQYDNYDCYPMVTVTKQTEVVLRQLQEIDKEEDDIASLMSICKIKQGE